MTPTDEKIEKIVQLLDKVVEAVEKLYERLQKLENPPPLSLKQGVDPSKWKCSNCSRFEPSCICKPKWYPGKVWHIE